MIPFLLWYIAISVVGWLTFPLAYRMLPFLGDRGLSVMRPLGLLIWGYVFWLLASLQVLQNDLGGILFAVGVLVALSFWAGRGLWSEMRAWLKEHRSIVLTMEVVFLAAFAAWAIVRAANPEIQYTEKSMELAFINSILRSPHFPPRDPWLSGYAISYYYFGYVIVAMLARVASVSSGVAFNLAIASWFALAAAAAYGIVFTLLKRLFSGSSEELRGRRAALGWALLAPFFVLVVSNLEGFLAMLHSGGLFWTQAADGTLQSKFWTWLGVLDLNQPPSQPFAWTPITDASWPWWRASRVLSDLKFNLQLGPNEVIDEFPFFSYLLADLHPHVLSMPFVLLAVALSLNVYLSRRPISTGRAWWQGLAHPEFWLAAVALGSLAFLNTWDFPIYVALYSGAVTLAQVQQWRASGVRAGWFGMFVRTAVTIGLAGVLLYLPFYLGFKSQAGGFLPSLIFFTPGRNFFVMFAPLLLPVFVYLLNRWTKQGNPHAVRAGLKFAGFAVFGLWIASYLVSLLVMALPGIGTKLVASNPDPSSALYGIGQRLADLGRLFYGIQGATEADGLQLLTTSLSRRLASPGTWLSLFVLLFLTWGLISVYRRAVASRAQVRYDEQVLGSVVAGSDDQGSGFVLLLILLGLGLTLMPEFFYLRDNFGWRMNTIFKFYFQAWILFALAAAYGSAVLLRKLRSTGGLLFRLGWLVLVAAALVYPMYMTLAKTNNFKPAVWTLDGNEYLSRYSPDLVQAFDWLSEAPVGVLAEGVSGSYDYGRLRYSAYSGQPAVIGWPGHESQWGRDGGLLATRETDMQTLYTTSDWTELQAILSRYQIRYVVVGPPEESLYNNPEKGLKLNSSLFQNYLSAVFSNAAVTIYEVPKDLIKEGQPTAWK